MPAIAVQPAWQTYADELAMLGHGLALWQPAPLHNYDKINIGDVGYIRQGRFHLLFSAAFPLGERRPGLDVPRNFVSIEPGPTVKDQPRLPGALHTEYIEQKGAGFSASSDITCVGVGTTFQFESSSKRGAILLTKYKTFCEDAERLGFFKDYLLRHYQSWVDFANQLGHMVNLEDILLVTGHDMTLDFAMLAFSSNSRQIGIEFEAGLPAVASASASVWGTWRTTMSVHHNCGPQHREPPVDARALLTDDSTPNDLQQKYNQCVFLRGFRIRKRAGFIPTVIKAAAGPHELGPGHRFDEDGPLLQKEVGVGTDDEVMVFSDTPSFVDPLDPLFRYIFENSTANVALVNDFDFSSLLKFTGTSVAEDMETLVSRLSPNIIDAALDGVACIKIPRKGEDERRPVDVSWTASIVSQDVITIGEDSPKDGNRSTHKIKTTIPLEKSLSGPLLEIEGGLGSTSETSLDGPPSNLFDGKPGSSSDRGIGWGGSVHPRTSTTRVSMPGVEAKVEVEAIEGASLAHTELYQDRINRVSGVPGSSNRPSATGAAGRSLPLNPSGERKPLSMRSRNEAPKIDPLRVPTSKPRFEDVSSRTREAGVGSGRVARRAFISGTAARPLPPRPMLSTMVQAQRHEHKHEATGNLRQPQPSSRFSPRLLPSDSAPSRKTRSRPPIPIGPRKPSRRAVHAQPLSVSVNMSMASLASIHSMSVTSLRPPASAFTSKADLDPLLFNSHPRATHWRASPMDTARWTFTSKHLQDIIGRAVQRSANVPSIRLFRLDILDRELPKEIGRLEALRDDIQVKYHAMVGRRRFLSRSISLYSEGGDMHTPARLSQELVDVSLACEQLSEDLFRVMDELQQINNLRDVHSESALAMALRKLNSSLVKQSSHVIDLKAQMKQLEVERNEAWQTAERYRQDLTDLQAEVEIILGGAFKARSHHPIALSAAASWDAPTSGKYVPESEMPTPQIPYPPSPKLSSSAGLPSASVDVSSSINMTSALPNTRTTASVDAQNGLYDTLGIKGADSGRTCSGGLSSASMPASASPPPSPGFMIRPDSDVASSSGLDRDNFPLGSHLVHSTYDDAPKEGESQFMPAGIGPH